MYGLTRKGIRKQKQKKNLRSKIFLIFFLPIPLVTPSLMIQWKLDERSVICFLDCRSRKQKRKNKPITVQFDKQHGANSTNNIGLFFRFRFRLRQSGFHEIVSDGVISGISVLLPTPSVWFSLDRIALGFWLRLRLRLRHQWKPAFNILTLSQQTVF